MSNTFKEPIGIEDIDKANEELNASQHRLRMALKDWQEKSFRAIQQVELYDVGGDKPSSLEELEVKHIHDDLHNQLGETFDCVVNAVEQWSK